VLFFFSTPPARERDDVECSGPHAFAHMYTRALHVAGVFAVQSVHATIVFAGSFGSFSGSCSFFTGA